MGNELHTVFKFALPFAIPIPDDIYSVKVKGKTAQISIKRIQRRKIEDGGWEITGTVEIMFDKYGRGSFSHVSIKFPEKMSVSEEGRKPLLLDTPPRNKTKETVIRFMNRFIEVVRYVTGEYHLEPLAYSDILSYKMNYWDGQTLHPAGQVLMDTGTGGIRLGAPPPFESEKLEQIKVLLATEKPLDIANTFILNAKDACLKEDFRLATVDAVTALEIKLSEFIDKRGQQLGISEEDLKKFKINVGLTGNIKVVLRMLTEHLEKINDEIINECKGAITVRNKILHEGRTNIPPKKTEERIKAIEKMIDYLRRLIESVENGGEG